MSNNQTQQGYVVNVPEIGEIDLVGNVASIEITQKIMEESASKGCMSEIAKLVLWLASFPDKLINLLCVDMAASMSGGSSCLFTAALWFFRLVWYGSLIAGTYGIALILYLICVSYATMDIKEEKLICKIQLKDGRSFSLKLDQEKYQMLKKTALVSNESISEASKPGETGLPLEGLDEVFEEMEEKLEILIDCRTSNIVNEQDFQRKLSNLEVGYFAEELITKIERAKESGILTGEDYEKARAEIDNRSSWDHVKQMALGKFFLKSKSDLIKVRGLYWLQKTSDEGNLDATNFLGTFYRSKSDEEGNLLKALDYFQKSEQAGSAYGTYSLGCMYENGEGIEADATKAQECFKLAFERGFQPAKAKIKEKNAESQTDRYDRLEKLAALKEKGHLSEEEFQQEKKKLFES